MIITLSGIYWFAIIFAVGLVLNLIAAKLKLSDVLLLIIFGVLIRYIGFVDIQKLIPANVLVGFSIFALILIIFDSSTKFKLSELVKFSPYSLKLALFFLFLNVVLLTAFVHLFFTKSLLDFQFLSVSILFSALMSGTAPEITLSIFRGFKNIKNKIIEILEFESVINTPLTLIIPLIILDFYKGVLKTNIFILQFLNQIMTGVGTGLVLGIVIFMLMRRKLFKSISPLIIISTALGSYALAEILGGSGVISVTVLGIVFSRLYIKEKFKLERFTETFTLFFKIIVFILLGMLIAVPLDKYFLIKSGILFLIFLGLRYAAVNYTFIKSSISIKEKLFMGLNAPKGIATVLLAFVLSTEEISQPEIILGLIFAFIVYSLLISSLTSSLSGWMLRLNEPEKSILKRLKGNKKL